MSEQHQTKKSHELDMNKILDAVGQDRYKLVLLASTRAREIAFARTLATRKDPSLKFENTPKTQALYEIEIGQIGLDYFTKTK